jgi:diguanylate cyclase (GGDEF)-like protein
MTQTRFDELKATGQLPSPTGVALAILRLTQDDKTTIAEITKVLQSDPSLSGRILKYANSAAMGGIQPIAAVSQAVARLGLQTVRQLALGFSVVSNCRRNLCKGFDYQKFWSRSLATGLAAQALAHATKSAAPEEAFTCGLLGQIGRLALASVYPHEYDNVLAVSEASEEELLELEQQTFATDHHELTLAMLRDWGLPETCVDAVRICGQWQNNGTLPDGSQAGALATLLHVAAHLSAVCIAADQRDALILGYLTCGAQTRIKPEDLLALADRVVNEWREWGKILDVATQQIPSFVDLAERARQSQDVDMPPCCHKDGVRPIEIGGCHSTKSVCTDYVNGGATSGAEGRVSGGTTNPTPESQRVNESVTPLTQDESIDPLTHELSGLRLLVVDDDPVTLRLLTKQLTALGHTVHTAANGRAALRLVLETDPQLILTDWQMPELDGIGLCQSLRQTKAGQQIYIIMLTANEDEDHLVQALSAGADDYMVKPVRPRVLEARVRAAQRIIQLQEKIERDKEEIQQYVAQLAIMNRKLEQAAFTDALTNLPNRRYATDRLKQEWAASIRSQRPLSCMIMDIDHFKQVNDTYGHDVGDVVLQETAAVLKKSLRLNDVVCRLGGEEFLVICADTDVRGAVVCAERLRRAVETHIIKTLGFNRSVTISVGVASRGREMSRPDAMLKAADQALYAAKQSGRNRVCAIAPVPLPPEDQLRRTA